LPLLLLFYIQKNKPIADGENSPENNKISVKTSETKTSTGMKTVEPPAKIDREKIERDLEKVLPSKPNLAGWDYEVFVMANRIAITNNYSPILENQFGKKNPNWIYPDNIFIIPTGERIIVQKGDTLWKIAGDFLLIAHDNFTKTYQQISDQIKDGDKPDKKLIAEAKNWAFTGHDKALLKSVSER
ncbi:MAG TPA: LysM peptidoglycan-binding domain-containing protein, partial [Spirochaetota bacterium]|nr:LysM peptidoglycan-binding domain-containing protein [Spirochaetota bacterium]